MLDKNRYQKKYQQQVPSSSNKHHQHSFQSHQSHQHPNSHYKAFSNHSNENYDIPGSTYFGPSSSGGNRYSRRESGSFGDGNKDKDRVAIPHGSKDLNVNGNRENAKSRFNSTLTFPQRSARNHTSRHVEKAIRVNPFPVHTSLSPYDLGSQVGEGTYGQVFKALCKSTGKFVALKKLYLKEDDKGKEKNRDGFPITGIREIEILRSLNHQCIVKLEAMVSCSTGPDNLDMFMVFEYMDHDLTGILNNSAAVYTVPHIKCLSQQLFEGLAYLHSQNIIHRDVKGANLLLNKEGYLKIADFGLARRLHVDRDTGIPLEGFEYTNRVVTLWYRSPELLYGSTSYGFEVDIWSAGCIIIEFYTKWALFQGRTEIDQLELIFKLCGTPTEEHWPEAKDLPWYGILKFPACERILVNEFKGPTYSLAPDFADLIDQLLTLNPANRPTADQALSHEFFSNEPQPCKRNELPIIEGDWHEYEGKMRRKNKTQPISANAPPPLPLSDLSSQSKLSKKNQSLQNEGEVVSAEDINHQDTYSNRANEREAFRGKESFRSHNSRSRSPPKDSSYTYRGIDDGSRYRDRGGWNRDPYYKSRSPSPVSNWKSQNYTADGKSHGRKRSPSPKDDREEKEERSRTSFGGRSGSPLSKRPRRSVSPNPARSSSFNSRDPPSLVKSEIWRQYHSRILRGAR